MPSHLRWVLPSRYIWYFIVAVCMYIMGMLQGTLLPVLLTQGNLRIGSASIRNSWNFELFENKGSNSYPSSLLIGPPLQRVLRGVRTIDILPPLSSMFPTAPKNCTCAWFQFAHFNHEYRRLLIISAGGTGTTYLQSMLHNHIYKYGWYVNHAIHMDGFNFMWKHVYPADASIYFGPEEDKINWVSDKLPMDGRIFKLALQCYKPDRILYLLNEPVSALRSLYRRGFQTSTTAVAAGFDLSMEKYRSWDNYTAHVENVMKTHRDLSGRFQHLISWLVTDVPCPLLISDFTTIVQNKQMLADYLSIPLDTIELLHEKPRKSNNLTEFTSIEGYTYTTLYKVLYKQMLLFNQHLRIPIDYQDPIDLFSLRHEIKIQKFKLWPVQAEDYPYNKSWPQEGIVSSNSSVRRCTPNMTVNEAWLSMEPTNISNYNLNA